MDNPIILHVNYVEQGQSVAEMCQRAVAWGYDGVEFRRKRSDVPETMDEYLDAIARGVEETELKHVLFGGPGPNLVAADRAAREADIEECVAFYRAAASRFDLTVCNTMTGVVMAPGARYDEYGRNGSSAATEEHWQWAVEGFQTLGDLAAELGFLFAFEIHNCYLHDLPEPARKLVDRIDRPSVGINFDYGNIIWHPSDPGLAEAIQVCAGRTYYVHLKNSFVVTDGGQPISIRCGLADGVINNRDLLRQVEASGFRGPICIEAPRQGDREQFAKEDIAYLRSVMAEV